jgi:hypothetical protein
MRTIITLLAWVLFAQGWEHLLMFPILLVAIGGDLRNDALLRGEYEPPVMFNFRRRSKK